MAPAYGMAFYPRTIILKHDYAATIISERGSKEVIKITQIKLNYEAHGTDSALPRTVNRRARVLGGGMAARALV